MRKFESLVNAWHIDPTPSSVREEWASSEIRKGGYNATSYRNPAFDAVIDSAVREMNPARSVELYRRLRDYTGRDPGWREVGSLRLASSKERLLELKRQVGWARTFGLPLSLISPEEARDLFPLMSIAGVEGAAYLPTDGRIDPDVPIGKRGRGHIERSPPGRWSLLSRVRFTPLGGAIGCWSAR